MSRGTARPLVWRFIDKAAWGDGPWVGEPDKVQWRDRSTGLFCLANRNLWIGNWCGYVGVRPSHPAYGKNYDDDVLASVSVHGGLTFAEGCRPPRADPAAFADEIAFSGARLLPGADLTEARICHVAPTPAEDDVWWLGWDAGHAWDLMPARAGWRRRVAPELPLTDFPYETYRDLAYVKRECRRLARQLARMPT